MKRILTLVLALVLLCSSCLALAACGTTTYTVGICQLVPHAALDAATKGFKDALEAELGKGNVTFLEQNAGGDETVCSTIVTDFVSKNVNLIMANATAALAAAANATTTIPILGTSVTDYATALNMTVTDGLTGRNISGTSDLVSLEDQAKLTAELYPAATHQKVALLYCSAEENSKFQADGIKPLLESRGYTVDTFTYSEINDMGSVAQAASAWADVIYVPTDNMAAENGTIILQNIGSDPLIAGEEGICSLCGVATLAISYYDLGYATGKMAAKILKGEAKVEEMPIETVSPTKKYNASRASALGMTVPEGFVAIGAN